MKKQLTLWVLLICTHWLQSQTIIVKNSETQKPIPGVILLQEHPLVSNTTNSLGEVSLRYFDLSRSIELSTEGFQSKKLNLGTEFNGTLEVFLDPQSLKLSEIIVSATRWHESSKNIPLQTTSISSKEMDRYQPQTAADLLGTSGKVFIQKSQQGGGSPMIRGFATNRLIYTVDGVRMNTAIFRGGNLQNVINLDPFNTEHTEVIFGPGSVIYGSDAIGGVMSFQTLKPELSYMDKPLVNGNAHIRYSNANKEQTAHIDLKIGLKKWAFVSSFTHWNFDHLRQGKYGPNEYVKSNYVNRINNTDSIIEQSDPLLQIPTGYQQYNFMQKVLFKPNEKWEFEYGFHYSSTSNYGRYDRHNRTRNGFPRYAEWNYGPQLWLMHLLQMNHRGNTQLYDQLDIRIASQQFEESRIDRSLNSLFRNTQLEKVLAYSLNMDFSKSLGPENTLFYGVEAVLNDVTSSGRITQIQSQVSKLGPSRYPISTWHSWGIYATDEQELGEKWTLRTGIRYNGFGLASDFTQNVSFYPLPFQSTEMNNEALTGSAGLVFRPNNSLLVRSNFGTAFRSPNVDDMGKIFDSEPGTITIPNPNLEAEYAYNIDFGIVKIIDEIFKIELNAYATHLSNALVRRNYQLNGLDSLYFQGEFSQIQAVQNAAFARVHGLSFGWEWKWTNELYWKTDLNYQNGFEELNNGNISPSRHAAPLFGISRFKYQNKSTSCELNIRFQGKRSHEELAVEERNKIEIYAKDDNGNSYSPSWYILNLRTEFRVTDRFRVNTGIENITDQRYRPYSSGVSGAGRNIYLSLNANF